MMLKHCPLDLHYLRGQFLIRYTTRWTRRTDNAANRLADGKNLLHCKLSPEFLNDNGSVTL